MKILLTNSPLHFSHGHTFTQPDWQTLVLPLLAGGQGGSFFDELLLQSGIDYVVRGEGEVTLRELISAIDEGEADLAGIPGLSFKRADGIYRTAERPKIKDLDDSPFPAIDLMPPRKSRWFPRRLTGSIETSPGCPYDCNFCAITAFWDRSFREKSNERIIEEMKLLSRRGRTHLYLADDNFGMNVKKHVDLFERILREGLDVRFFAQMRTDTIALHPEMVALAARAGLYGALIGFDTYEPDTFHHVTKVGSVELNLKCAELMRKNKIMIFGSHIYALPSQKKPLDFARTFWTGRQNSDLFRMPHFSMLPGTKAYGKMITQEALDSKKGDDDFRLFIRPAKEQARFRRWYTIFNFLNILLPDEILKALFHPNPSVRKIKQRGYIGIGRHYLYKVLGRFGLCDV